MDFLALALRVEQNFKVQSARKFQFLKNRNKSKKGQNLRFIIHILKLASKLGIEIHPLSNFQLFMTFFRILCRFLCLWFLKILPTILSAGTVAVNTNSYTIGCCMKSIEYRVTKIWQLDFKWYGKSLKAFLLVYLFVYWFDRIKTSRVKMTPLSVQIVGKNLLVVLGLMRGDGKFLAHLVRENWENETTSWHQGLRTQFK